MNLNYFKFLFLIILNNYFFAGLQCDSLDNYLEDYDKVVYDETTQNTLKTLNARYKRSQNINQDLHKKLNLIQQDEFVYLNFSSFGRVFKLKLKPTKNHFFMDDKSVELDQIVLKKDYITDKFDNYYDGVLLDEPEDSYVNGILFERRLFYGTIQSNKYGNFIIEPSKRYNITSSESESIIYNEKHLKVDKLLKKRSVSPSKSNDFDTAGCAFSNDNVKNWMQKEQKQVFEEKQNNQGFDPYDYIDEDRQEDERTKYSSESNKNFHKKRNSDSLTEDVKPTRLQFPDKRTVCNLYLRVDPTLYIEIFKNEGNRNVDTTITYLLFFMNKHVEFLNSVYNSLPFYDSNKEKYLIGVQFMIHRTKIITDELCNRNTTNKLTDEEYKLCEPYLDVSTFLDYVSMDNYTDYCLAYTFTARDFADGTLGLAWVAKLTSSVGGVCEKRQPIKGSSKSLNSGIVTVVNYQSRVPEIVSQLTFTHEVGHNFGSEHDPKDEKCSPGKDNGGNFIMYRSATTGREKNNRNFSDCSKDQMGPVLHALVKNPTKFCFKTYNGSLCGNGIVENGEECDCGYSGECKDVCCHDASEKDASKRCKLKPHAKCSPTQGHCCNSKTCQFEQPNIVCLQSTECLHSVTCSGNNSKCPTNLSVFFKKNYTSCNSGTQVCINGVCSGSICEKFNMSQCYLDGDLKSKATNKSLLCHLACTGSKTSNKCVDSFDIPEITNRNSSAGLILKPGSPCMGTLGYCDIFSKCRSVDAEGPLSRLKKILLNRETITKVQTWIRNYWYAFVLFVVGLIVFTITFVKVCSVHTRSSNPYRPAALKITDTLKRPIRRHHHQPHASNLNYLPTTIELVERNPKRVHKKKSEK